MVDGLGTNRFEQFCSGFPLVSYIEGEGFQKYLSHCCSLVVKIRCNCNANNIRRETREDFKDSIINGND